MGYMKWDRFSDIDAFTTTRQGGVSLPPFDTFNLAYHVGDNHEDVFKNRQIIYKDFKIKPLHLVCAYQSHGTVIAKVSPKHYGCGELQYESGIPADALYTEEKDVALGIFHADCVPVFLYAKKDGIIGVIHAGQTGTLKGVTAIAIQHLIDFEGVDPKEIYAFLGPSLTFSHNVIDEDMKKKVIALGPEFVYGLKETNGETFLDVALLNFLQLRSKGIPAVNITISDLCTFENKDLFFSYKRNNLTGRQMSVIKFK